MAGGELRGENLQLLEVNIPVLVANQDEQFFESLRGISSYYTAEKLQSMAQNARNELYVLAGIHEEQIVIRSVIQVYIEGKGIGLPSDHSQTMKVQDCFPMIPGLYWRSDAPEFHTANVVQCHSVSEGYDIAALDHLTRYYNTPASEHASDEPAPKRNRQGLDQSLPGHLSKLKQRPYNVHFLGRIIELDVDMLNKCLMEGFSLLFAGKAKKKSPNVCVVIKALKAYDVDLRPAFNDSLAVFMFSVGGNMKHVNREFGLRVLEVLKNESAATHITEWPWTDMDRHVMSGYNAKCDDALEPVAHLIPEIAREYFAGKLPLDLSEQEEHLLFLKGLQRRDYTNTSEALEISRKEYLRLYLGIFSKVLTHFGPQVEMPPLIKFRDKSLGCGRLSG